MKKSSTLAQQIIKAQRAVDSWPDSLKSGLRFESLDNYITSPAEDQHTSRATTKKHVNSK